MSVSLSAVKNIFRQKYWLLLYLMKQDSGEERWRGHLTHSENDMLIHKA